MADELHAQLLSLARHVRDPQRYAPPPGIEARRLAVYRQLFFGNVEGLLAGASRCSVPAWVTRAGRRWCAASTPSITAVRRCSPSWPGSS